MAHNHDTHEHTHQAVEEVEETHEHVHRPAQQTHEHAHEGAENDAVKRQLEAGRKQKDKFFAEHPQSPLLEEHKADFKGANYYPVDLAYRVLAHLVEEAHPGTFKVQTTTGDHKEYTRAGRLHFELDGKPLSLVAFLPPAEEKLHGGRLFVPFRDKTSGKETYGAGRYIDLNKRPSNDYILDFNRAYNPYCAYSPNYSCPIPPGENNLPVEIRAGEKLFHEE